VLTDEDWQDILNLNLLAAVRLDRAFLPGMLERKSGVVIHISSVAHRLPFSNSTLAYAAAKGALSTYSKGLAKGVAPQGVAGSLGMATGPLAGGLIYDTFASYGWLYIGAWGVGIGAFLIALTFRPYAAKPTPEPARAAG
jgi:NAD(P)-dependent dehydrogenase (short-subunit alcohol dehydrogenase family)